MLTKYFEHYWKSILVAVVILVLSFIKTPSLGELPAIKFGDKYVHLCMYLFFSMALFYDAHSRNPKRTLFAVSVVFPVVLGGVVEVLQGTLFKPRSAEWLDWASDILGSLIGYAVMYCVFRKKINLKQ